MFLFFFFSKHKRYVLGAVLKFQVEGLRKWGHEGFAKHQKKWNPTDLDVDLTGRVIIVTGANSGLGYACTTELAKRKATIWMLCRNKDKAEKAKEEIVQKTGNQNINIHLIDMSRPAQIKSFAQEFIKGGSRLDCIINNAGLLLEKREVTEDKIEMTFATNTLAGFLLTEYLLPALEKTKGSRVINVSSGGQYSVKMDTKDWQIENKSYGGTQAYAFTKRHQRYLSEIWAKKFGDKGIHFWSCHPGWARTPQTKTALPSFFDKLNLRDEYEGSDTMVWLAASEAAFQIPNGSFVFDRKVAKGDFSNATICNEEEIESLYQYCLKFKEAM